ncbi:MAG TPA: heparan-alpha-glucosaminide N-acetyltransferase domain-containing protein [Terriglobales bacterium]
MATVSSRVVETISIKSVSALAQAPRLISVDLLHGVVMVIMALDHTRDFFTYLRISPEDITQTYGALFFTRVITHFCAPVFCFLAGTGAFLATSRGKTVGQVSWLFFTRGLWLVFLELTVCSFAWTFSPSYLFSGALVLWALGWSMVAMALLVRLPVRWIAGLGLFMMATHNLLDPINPASFGKFSWLWMMIHTPGFYFFTPHFGFNIYYSLVPYIGIMASGYAFGTILQRPDRRKVILRLGFAATSLFFVVRGINHYGNGLANMPFGYSLSAGPWIVQPTHTLTIISFFNTLKYPPSLDYLLMTLGPALIALGLFEGARADRGLSRFFLVYGRVPMFYYLSHLYLIHIMTFVVAWICHQPTYNLWHGGIFTSPDNGYGHGLPFIYAIWISAVLILYYPCRWFMEYKRRHRDWNWLPIFRRVRWLRKTNRVLQVIC